MKDYLNFSTEDFAQDDFFIQWVKSESIAADTFWENWIKRYPHKQKEMEAARQLVIITQHLPLPDISDAKIHYLKESVFAKISTLESKKRQIWPYIPNWAVAAAVSGLLVFAAWYTLTERTPLENQYTQFASGATEKSQIREVFNQSKSAMLVNLPDGSSVTLRKGSKLSYPNEFSNDSREIFLTGEAFFEVAKDPLKPFYVYANQIVTKVLGTSFNIRAYQHDEEVLVTVKTGRVSVYKVKSNEALNQASNNRLEGMVLLPDQQAHYTNKKIKLVNSPDESKYLTDNPKLSEMSFEYVEKPISEIFNQLEKAYNINFVYDSTVMAKCPITASLTGEPLNQKLHLICKAIGANYKIVNETVTITGNGCE